MNIFVLDNNIQKCAQYHCDKHVGKMLLESCQLLCTAHHVLDGDNKREGILYKSTHKAHPASIWCREKVDNYIWLYHLARHLSEEYTKRYHKVHLSWKRHSKVLSMPPSAQIDVSRISRFEPSPHPLCMPDEYKIEGDTVQSYRNYYLHEKSDFAQWNHSPKPPWWEVIEKPPITSSLRGFANISV